MSKDLNKVNEIDDERSNYSLLPEERETHLVITDADKDTWYLETSRKKDIKMLQKLGLEPYSTETINGEVVSAKFKIPFAQVLIRKERKKVEYSEKRRAKLREHMKNISKTSKKDEEEQEVI